MPKNGDRLHARSLPQYSEKPPLIPFLIQLCCMWNPRNKSELDFHAKIKVTQAVPRTCLGFDKSLGFVSATLECLCTFKEIDPIFDRVLLSRTASA